MDPLYVVSGAKVGCSKCFDTVEFTPTIEAKIGGKKVATVKCSTPDDFERPFCECLRPTEDEESDTPECEPDFMPEWFGSSDTVGFAPYLPDKAVYENAADGVLVLESVLICLQGGVVFFEDDGQGHLNNFCADEFDFFDFMTRFYLAELMEKGIVDCIEVNGIMFYYFKDPEKYTFYWANESSGDYPYKWGQLVWADIDGKMRMFTFDEGGLEDFANGYEAMMNSNGDWANSRVPFGQFHPDPLKWLYENDAAPFPTHEAAADIFNHYHHKSPVLPDSMDRDYLEQMAKWYTTPGNSDAMTDAMLAYLLWWEGAILRDDPNYKTTFTKEELDYAAQWWGGKTKGRWQFAAELEAHADMLCQNSAQGWVTYARQWWYDELHWYYADASIADMSSDGWDTTAPGTQGWWMEFLWGPFTEKISMVGEAL